MPIHSVRLPGLVAHQEVILGGRGRDADDPPRHDLARGVRPGRGARALEGRRAPAGRHGRPRRSALNLVEERSRSAELELDAAAPARARGALDEEAFADDEFMPYWAELWPSGLALARALPARLDGLRVVELGCGLGVPSLVAAARGARVTAIDWAAEAIELLRRRTRRGTASSSTRRPRRLARIRRLASTSCSAPTCSTRSATARRCSSCCPRSRRRVLLAEPGRATARSSSTQARPALERHGDRRPRLRTRLRLTRCSGGVLTAIVTPFDERGAVDFDAFQALAPAPGRQRLRRARRRRHDRREPDARPTARGSTCSGPRSRRSATVRPSSRTPARLDRALGRADRAGARARRRRLPRRHAVLQQAAAARDRRALRGDRRRDATGRSSSTTSRAGSSSNIEPETISRLAEIPNVTRRQAGPRRSRRGPPHRRRSGLDLYAGDDELAAAVPRARRRRRRSASTRTSSGPQVAEQVRAVASGDLERAREIDAELRPAYELLRDHDEPDPDQGRAEPARPRGRRVPAAARAADRRRARARARLPRAARAARRCLAPTRAARGAPP